MARSLFRVTYYDGNKQLQVDVVATTIGEAAAHLGISQWIAASEISINVEVAGLDKAHAKVEPRKPNIMPPYMAPLTQAEIDQLKSLVTKRQGG